MPPRRVLLIVDRPDLRAQYEMILRFSGYEPVAFDGRDELQPLPDDVAAACILSDHGRSDAELCTRLMAAAIPVVRIDPFVRHGREHLPFDVVLPLAGEPRQIIAALRHLGH